MDELIVRVLPSEIRRRYGDELVDLLGDSRRPWRDRADIALAAIGLRLGRALLALVIVAGLVSCVLAVGMAHAVGQLSDGVVEVPDHWWSSFIAVALTAAGLITVGLAAAMQRSRSFLRIHR